VVQAFYGPVSTLCFTLLGLWWVAVQIRGGELFANAEWRRTVYGISVYFMLPGLMSLLALVSPGVSALWRVAFVLAGLLGATESALALRSTRFMAGRSSRMTAARWATIALYVLIALVGAAPEVASDLADLPPLLVEGILVSLMIVLGANLAWMALVHAAESRTPLPPSSAG